MLATGKAKSAFLEKYPQSVLARHGLAIRGMWPFLNRMLAIKCVDYVDVALARRFAGNSEESLAALLCYLSLTARQGHLCIQIDDNRVTPDPEEVLTLEDRNEAIQQEDIETFRSLIIRGITHEALHRAPVKKNKHYYYLHRYWSLESYFLDQLTTILSMSRPPIPVDTEKAALFLNTVNLLPEQKDAVLQACQSPLTLITGGPGTGKTYTAGVVLNTLWHAMSPEQRHRCRISLAAPTGKAAANLEASIKKVNGSDFPMASAQTLHQLLKIHQSYPKGCHVLPSDIILVDECSMIDVHLMGHLLVSIKPGARLIMLGDKDQLPSVEAGSLFADLAEVLAEKEQTRKYIVELKTCLRAESQQIIELASHMKSGDEREVIRLLTLPQEDSTTRLMEPIEDITEKEWQHLLLKRVLPHFPILSKVPEDLLQLLKQTSRFQMLSPMRKGCLGVDSLNATIFQALRGKMLRAGCEIVPILMTQNDYRLELFNGEVGLLISEGNHASAYGVFFSRESSESIRKIPALMLSRYELAYCLSVHKSQGSEFDHVLLVLPEGSEVFGRAALYTGATRARKQLDIWGASATVERMLRVTSRRQSGVLMRAVTGNRYGRP